MHMKAEKKNKKALLPAAFLAPYFIAYGLFFVYPVIYSFFISLTDWDSVAGVANRHLIGFQNYIQIFTKDKLFWMGVKNTVLFMVIYIPILLVLGLALAVLMNNLARGRRIFQTINILPYVTTPVAIGMIFSFMFDWKTGIVNKVLMQVGLIDEGINWLGSPFTARVVVILLIVWKNLGYYFLIYLAALSTVPNDIIEAARVDGATGPQVFWRIIFLYLKPITMFLFVTSIISGFQLFDEPYLLFASANTSLGGPEHSSMTAMWYFFDQTFKSSTKLGYGAAVSYALFLLILVVSILVSKLSGKEDAA